MANAMQYGDDERFPGPAIHPPPAFIQGIPTQADLDSYPRIFTWGELKGIVRSGDLVHLMRNKELQARYDDWMIGQKQKYGSTEKYLTQARLPWAHPPLDPPDTYAGAPGPKDPNGPVPAMDLAAPLNGNSSGSSKPVPSLASISTSPAGPSPADPLAGLPRTPTSATPTVPSVSSGPSVPSTPSGPSVFPSASAGNGIGRSTYASPSHAPAPAPAAALGRAATPGGAGIHTPTQPGSGASTPSSAGFVSLDSLKLVDGKLRRSRSARSARSGRSVSLRGPVDGEGAASPGAKTKREWEDLSAPGSPVPASAARARFRDQETGSDSAAGAGGKMLVNGNGHGNSAGHASGDDEQDGEGSEDEEDEDELVYLKFDPAKGLDADKFAVLPNDWPYNVPYGVKHFCVWCRVPIAHPVLVDYSPSAWATIESNGLGGFTGITPLRPYPPAYLAAEASANSPPPGFVGTKFFPKLRPEDYYTADVHSGGRDLREWAGVEYESVGGSEVGGMVRGLWDPRGWETAWFVNPPRLQSVPGFAHFHVFARRKTPTEIDASVKAWDEGWRG